MANRPKHTLIIAAGLFLSAGMACNLSGASPTAAPQPPTEAAPTAEPSPTSVPAPTATQTEVAPTPTEEPPRSVSSLPDPSKFRWNEVAGGFLQPLDLQHGGDERLFVVEQRGLIWVLEDGAAREEPFLDLRDRVNAGASEQGLLGLALHPEYQLNGRLFVNYTGPSGETVVARFSADVEQARGDPNSEQMLLRIAQPYRNHNGGGLAFGPDRLLYIGTGDGGSAGDPLGSGQRLDTLLGKILRIDPDSGSPYGIPSDNPFAAGGGLPEIWAWGLRNPWRFAFDPAAGDLFIGDVGQNSWEEVDHIPAGSPGGVNFGWNLREGAHPFAGQGTEGLTDPIAEYRNGGGDCSVTGGVVVRNPSLPEWDGIFLYGDYCSGKVWGVVVDEGAGISSGLLFQTGLRISSFGVDVEGGVYLVHHGGAIFRLERVP